MPSVTEENLFPHDQFPVRLELKSENRICWFKDTVDLQKYLERYKLDKRKVKIDYRDGEPTESGKGNKNKVRQRTGNTNSGSATTTRRSTKKLDSTKNTRNTSSTRKSKAKPKPKSK